MITVSPQIRARIRQPETVTLFVVAILCALFLLGVGASAATSAVVTSTPAPTAIDKATVNLTTKSSVKPKLNQTLADLKLAAEFAVANQPVEGLKVLARLDESLMTDGERDIYRITKARVLTQANQLDLALENYNSITNKSSFWLASLEEKAEVTARKGDFAKAIGILQTTLAPQFKDQVHPATYFVAALTHLKICDYPGVFKVTNQFKEQIKPRVATWKEQAAQGDKDAQANLAETSTTVSQLQVIEADVIHRMALADGAANGPQQGKIAKGSDVMMFPQSDEVWSDELDHFSAEVKQCEAPHLHMASVTRKSRI
jgi:hypothetical protein